MNSIGSPTLLTHLRLSNAAASLRRQSETARSEVATGRIADLNLALGSASAETSLMRRALDGVAAHRTAIARADLRLGVVQSSIASVASGAQALDAELLAAIGRGDERTIANLGGQAKSALERAFAQLNVRAEGRSVFAGDAVDQPALSDPQILLADVAQIYANASDASQLQSDLDAYFNDPAGGFETTIYAGGAGAPSRLSISDDDQVSGAVKANDQPFKDVLRGLAVIAAAASAPRSDYRDSALAAAGAGAVSGSTALADLGARIGVEQQRVAAASDSLDIEETALTNAYNARTSVDPYEAASRLQGLENQLQASYLLAARLSQLTLTNFLR